MESAIFDDVLGIPGEEETGFVIDTDEKAEWAMRKIADEQADFDRLNECCQKMIDSYREKQKAYAERYTSHTDGLKAMLRAYFDTTNAKETKTQRKYELPSGSLVLKKASSDFAPDEDKLLAWLQAEKMTGYLKTEISPRWAMVKKQLVQSPNGDIIFGETGEIVPEGCVTIQNKPETFEVKTK